MLQAELSSEKEQLLVDLLHLRSVNFHEGSTLATQESFLLCPQALRYVELKCGIAHLESNQ